MNKEYSLGSHIIMKKKHPCGSFEWKVIRLGADIKIECCGCKRVVLLPRIELNKRIKKVEEVQNERKEET